MNVPKFLVHALLATMGLVVSLSSFALGSMAPTIAFSRTERELAHADIASKAQGIRPKE